MIASPLRVLARRYARQDMNRARYRDERRDYLEEVLAGRVKVEYVDTLSQAPIAAAKKEGFDFSDWRSYLDFSDQRVRFAAIGLLAAVVGTWVLTYEPPPPPPAPIDAIVVDPTGIELVKNLLAQEPWTEDHLREFAGGWDQLTEEQQRFARFDPSFRRYRARIRQIIQDQQALAGLGDDQAAAFALLLEEIRTRVEGG